MHPNRDDLILENVQGSNINAIRIIHTRRFRLRSSVTSPRLLPLVTGWLKCIGASWRAISAVLSITLVGASSSLSFGLIGMFIEEVSVSLFRVRISIYISI